VSGMIVSPCTGISASLCFDITLQMTRWTWSRSTWPTAGGGELSVITIILLLYCAFLCDMHISESNAHFLELKHLTKMQVKDQKALRAMSASEPSKIDSKLIIKKHAHKDWQLPAPRACAQEDAREHNRLR